MNEMTQADYILGHSQIEMRRLMWQWTQIGWGPSHGPNGGVADTLNEAKAAFRAAGRARSQDHPYQPAESGALIALLQAGMRAISQSRIMSIRLRLENQTVEIRARRRITERASRIVLR
jgi:hypothetical protein